MADTYPYDPDEYLCSPSPDGVIQVLNNIVNQTYTDSSRNSSDSSSPQSTLYPVELLNNSLGIKCNGTAINAFSSTTQPTGILGIIAQPKALYRERYCSETDPTKNRAQRFIRADDEISDYEYPTIQIPPQWCDPNRYLYIRVTLVTVSSEKVPVICIHPYAIDTQENDVFRDSYTNSLYFPITKEEIRCGQKSFRISRKKLTQHELRSHGSLRLFNLDQYDIQRVTDLHDAKQLIETYQLWRSQLIFTIAEPLYQNTLPNPIHKTSVPSQIMCDEASERRKELSMSSDTSCANMSDDDTVICTPRKGDWKGGEGILMRIPKLNRRRAVDIYFDYGSTGRLIGMKVSFVDTKTVFFQTPPCAIPEAGENLSIPIIVIQNDIIVAQIEFVYLASIQTTRDLCSFCRFDMINNNPMSNEREYMMYDLTDSDGGDTLVAQMSRLTTEETSNESNHQPVTDDKKSRFDKYLNQIQEAVVKFVRTNDPSLLFRRTRLLIAKCEENPPPLDDAIQHNYINLALKLIEQTIDMPSERQGLLDRENTNGETPLLLAGKLNQWILIEAMLKQRLDLIEKSDKSNNNILHLLANVSNDKADKTIKNLLVLISPNLRIKLLKQKNKDNQTPIEIARMKNNNHCINLLKKL